MSREPVPDSISAEQLSALMDGEDDATGVARACHAWREAEAVRRTWHRYHLIGDVLRSEDLADGALGDRAFLGRLRERLAREPVVIAPQAAPAVTPLATARSLRRWRTSAAVAAGFVAVAGVLLVTRGPTAEEQQVAVAPSPAVKPAPVAVPAEAVAEAPPVVADGRLIRDVRLDRYLEAHQQFAGTSPFGSSSVFVRRAAADLANR